MVVGSSMLLLLRDLCQSFGTRRGEVGGGDGVGWIGGLAAIATIWREVPLRSRYHVQFKIVICGEIERDKGVSTFARR